MPGYDHLLRLIRATQSVKASLSVFFPRCYGSEFISRDLDLWAYHRGVVLNFSRPGKPTDNSYIESINGKFRAECLNARERPVNCFCGSGKSGDVLALEPALVLTLIPEQRGFMARMEIMSGTERRRRWSDEAKLRILAEADEPGARIGDVARRHDVHPGQIRLWRKSFNYVDRPTVFLPVEIMEEIGVSQASTTAARPAIVEILLRNGRSLKVPVDVELKLLGPLVACVEVA